MRPRLLLLLLSVSVLCLPPSVEADVISVDALLSDPHLSPAEPITFSVDFETQFASLNSVALEAFWIDDLLDPGEEIAFENLGGFTNVGDTSQFLRVLTFAPACGCIDEFLDGQFTGTVVAAPGTSVTFARLAFVADGVTTPAPVPAPPSLFLLGSGSVVVGGLGRAWRRKRSV